MQTPVGGTLGEGLHTPSLHPMYAEYRLLRTREHISFARVGVEAAPLPNGQIVATDAIANPDRRKGEVGRDRYPSWVSAAVEGASDTLTHLQMTNVIVGGTATIVRVIGSDVDTNEQSVRCAAALATWKAIAGQKPFPPLRFEHGNWSVDWTRT